MSAEQHVARRQPKLTAQARGRETADAYLRHYGSTWTLAGWQAFYRDLQPTPGMGRNVKWRRAACAEIIAAHIAKLERLGA